MSESVHGSDRQRFLSRAGDFSRPLDRQFVPVIAGAEGRSAVGSDELASPEETLLRHAPPPSQPDLSTDRALHGTEGLKGIATARV